LIFSNQDAILQNTDEPDCVPTETASQRNSQNQTCSQVKFQGFKGGYMFGFGMPELIIILVIVLVVFGAGRLPEIGGALGKSIRNFKKASDGKDEIEIKPKSEDEDKKA
jgi:sec-independent protein translocase protein TatA